MKKSRKGSNKSSAKRASRRKKLASKRKTLVKKLDTIVSQIVRTRDEYCVQCGTPENLTCGHVFSRRSYSTRWALDNCFAQCWSHNFQHSYDNYDYYKWYQDKFGEEKFTELRKQFKAPKRFTTLDLEDLYERMVEFKDLLERSKQ